MSDVLRRRPRPPDCFGLFPLRLFCAPPAAVSASVTLRLDLILEEGSQDAAHSPISARCLRVHSHGCPPRTPLIHSAPFSIEDDPQVLPCCCCCSLANPKHVSRLTSFIRVRKSDYPQTTSSHGVITRNLRRKGKKCRCGSQRDPPGPASEDGP
uniref:Uncharacterized protein n=1 Tax=Knipowitschia caucasica TaxID=637954 RepID=A0AAV2MQ67_KNICA